METGVMLDAVLGILMLGIGMMMRRFWQLVDNLRESDMTLHNRITKVQTETLSMYVQKQDFEQAVDRILSRIDRMEETLLHREGS
jgi:predicted ATPase|tara:strand:- start:298 stop:552 length:255 start_codon:yes stop_codon:yes gene_type:complete